MPSQFRFAGFELDPPSRALVLAGTPVAIEPKVFDVLSYLVEHRERAVGRDELIAAVWGRVDVSDATLQQAISRLRRVLRETADLPFVRTVSRHGYQWVAPTSRVTDAPTAAPADEEIPIETTVLAEPPVVMAPTVVSGPAPQRRLMPRLVGGAVIVALLLALLPMLGQRTRDTSSTLARTATSPSAVESAAVVASGCAPDRPARACAEELAAALTRDALGPTERITLLLQRAQQHVHAADTAAATTDLDAVDAALDAAAHPALAARALYLRHEVAVLEDRPDEALAFGQRALALYRGQEPSDAHAELLHSLGDNAGRRGELERALAWLDAARTMYEQTKNAAGTSRVLATTAYTLSQLGRFGEALDAARQAQAKAAPLSVELRREALIALAWASIQNGKLGEAREAVHDALRTLPVDANPSQAVSLHALLGFIDASGGRFQEALGAWDDALAHTPEGSQNASVAGLRLAIVYAALNLGDRQRAQAQFDKLQAMQTRAPELRQSTLHAAALLALADGDDAKAAAFFAQVWAAARTSGSVNQQMLADYADVLLRRKDLDTLETLLGEPSLPAREGHLYQLVQARYLAQRGRAADAQAAFDRALALAGERYSRWLDVARREVTAAKNPQ